MGTARVALVLTLLLGAAALAFGDVVHLTTGRTIKGEVVSENDREVVVKTPNGKLTLPRRIVKRIDRESKEATWLAQARTLAGQGDLRKAAKLYEKAARADDEKIAAAAAVELEALRERMAAKRAAPRPSPRPSQPPQPQDTPPEIAPAPGGSAVNQAAAKLRVGDGVGALALLEPLADSADDARFHYLHGRALELTGDATAARRAYLRVLTDLPPQPSARTAAWIGELARRSFATPLTATSPGVEKNWKRVETKHFAVYHRFSRVEPWFRSEPEKALKDVLSRLELTEADLELSGRIQVFIYESREGYESLAGGGRLTGGHAVQRQAPDGILKAIDAYPQASFYRTTYRHEIAHTVVFTLWPRLSSWAHEGVAVYAEPAESRGPLRAVVAGRLASGDLPPLETFLADQVPRGSDRLEVKGYYAQASVVFEALVDLLRSPRKALDLCEAIKAGGAEPALKKAGLSLKKLQRAVERRSKDSSQDR